MQQGKSTLHQDAWQLELILAKLGSAQEIEFSSREGAFNLHRHGARLQALAMQHLVEGLGLEPMLSARDAVEARLRLALHLAPVDAINYDSRATKSRKRYISEYLQEEFSYPEAVALEVARLVAQILDRWEADRKAVSGHRDQLLSEQEFRCAACHLDFSSEARVEREEELALANSDDPLKPYYDGSGAVEWMAPEVDHCVAISKDGTNAASNLQVICRLCNHGKGAGGAITADAELKYCADPVRSIPRPFRMRVFYNRIRIDGFRCQSCDSDHKELTLRRLRPRGLYTLSNLVTTCHDCLTPSAGCSVPVI